jgi:DNA-binding LacI/PurR family transcriptional regulator
LAEVVHGGLLRRLAGGMWGEAQRLPVVRRLEREFQVSRVTVLAALRRLADEGLVLVSPRHYATVAGGAAERAAQLLAERLSVPENRRVAVLFPESMMPPRFTFGPALERFLGPAAAGRNMQTEIIPWPCQDQPRFVERLLRRGYSGALAFGLDGRLLPTVYEMHRRCFPLVVFNRRIPELDVPSVLLDETGAVRKIASALAAMGHRNMCLVYLAFDDRLNEARQRADVWVDYLAESRLLQQCSMPLYYVRPREDVDLFAPLLGLERRPTAVVFGYGALLEAFARGRSDPGIRVPEEMSVASFDTLYGATLPSWCPPMTTLYDDPRRSVECMVETLDRMWRGERHPRSIRVPMDLHRTDSIGPAPQ